MIFKNAFFESCFNYAAIEQFYKIISTQLEGISLEWRENKTVVDNPSDANIAIIARYGKQIFAINDNNHRGFVNLENIKGNETLIYNALIESELLDISEAPSYSKAILYATVHILLVLFIASINPNVTILLIIALTCLLGGEIVFAIGTKTGMSYGARLTTGIVSFIGFLALAPAALLHLPLVGVLNNSYIHNTAIKYYNPALAKVEVKQENEL